MEVNFLQLAKDIINNFVIKLNSDNQPKKIKKNIKLSKLIFSIDKKKIKDETQSQDEVNAPVNKGEILNPGLFQNDNYLNFSEYKDLRWLDIVTAIAIGLIGLFCDE